MKTRNKLTIDNIDEMEDKDIAFVSCADGGGMGSPGQIILITKDNESYEFNYASDRLSMRVFFSHFKSLKKVFGNYRLTEEEQKATGFIFVDLGLGNSLYVNINYYDNFVKALIKEVIEYCSNNDSPFCPSKIYFDKLEKIEHIDTVMRYKLWYKVAKKILVENKMLNLDVKVKSGIYGVIVGDALGLPVQFMERQEVKDLQVTEMLGYMEFNMPPGTWSDDGSLTLALVDSLSGGLSYADQMEKFQQWFNEGKYTQYGLSFDIGRGTMHAMLNNKANMDPTQAGPKNINSNGNGSLMRILPLAYWLYVNFGNHCMKNEDVYEIIHNTSALTHGHNISKIACGIYMNITCNLLNDMELKEAIHSGINSACSYYKNNPKFKEDFEVFERLLDKDFKNLDEDQIKSTGYVVDSLEAALWSLLNTNNYKECMLKAINLGDDTDTIAAIAGGLAGIAYGFDSIPKEWLDAIEKKELVYGLINQYTESLKSKKEVLYGAISGDVIGSVYERRANRIKHKNFPLFSEGCHFTDDSVMSLAIAQAFINGTSSDQIVKAMKTYGLKYPDAGYGSKFRYWFLEENPQPYNSIGNGSAMRVSPVAWVANNLKQVLKLAKQTAIVSHNNPEGIRGACAIACAIFLARTTKSKEEIKNYIQDNFYYDLTFTLDSIREDYRFDSTCMGSVPQAIVSFLEGKDYEDVIRNAISLGGDADTLAAMAGSIAEAYYGVPRFIRTKTYTHLTPDLIKVIKDFNEMING